MSGIEWTKETWNPVVGCSRVSAGCQSCYAEQSAGRVKACGVEHYQDVVHSPEGVDEYRWTGEVVEAEHKLAEPLSWGEPRRVFVDSMSDLFHPDVDFKYIAAVFGVMAACPDHTFQILTKRPERMREWFEWVDLRLGSSTVKCVDEAERHTGEGIVSPVGARLDDGSTQDWPLPNVWLGVSCEHQDAADERIPPLLECPAAGRFVSAEPLLGRVDLNDLGDDWHVDALAGGGQCCLGHENADSPALDWVIVGGESGADARPCRVENIRHIVEQCQSAEVPVFVKQLGFKPVAPKPSSSVLGDDTGDWRPNPPHKNREINLDDPKGGDPEEWPEDLRVREFPEEM